MTQRQMLPVSEEQLLNANSHVLRNDLRTNAHRWLVMGLISSKEAAAAGPVKTAEYINEAEHQDDAGYWDQFADLEELLGDFRLYTEFSEEG